MMRLKIILLISTIIFLFSTCRDYSLKAGHKIEVMDEKQIQIRNLNLTVEGKDQRQKVKPEDPSGYLKYYEQHAGYYYDLINGQADYDGKTKLQADHIKIIGTNGVEELEGFMIFSNEMDNSFANTIEGETVCNFYILFLIKEGSPTIKALDIYYNNQFFESKDQSLFDYQLHWEMKD